MRLYLVVFCALLAVSCDTSTPIQPNRNTVSTVNTNKNVNNSPNTNMNSVAASNALPVYGYEVVNSYKHDSKAFTQGLVFNNGFLYESTGQFGESTLRKVELETGKALQKYDIPNDVFGEGMTIMGDKVYQITWETGVGYVYNLDDFKLLKTFKYAGEGWGLTNDGKNLILSDGTHVLRFLDPNTFETVRTVTVFRETGQPLMKINELEYVKGELWANVWHSEDINLPNRIARIDPNSGKLLGWIDLDGISPEDYERDPENTLNGIAYDEATDRIFVTGKRWKKLFEIKLKAKN